MEQEKETPPPPPPPPPQQQQYAEAIPNSGSMASMESSKRTSMTRQSKRKATAQEQALLLSKATGQATAAAKSILLSGGTEETALLTARAAAESILIPSNFDKLVAFTNKRQAKQQAQVIASMALISAQASTNQFALGTETNIFIQAPASNSFATGSRKPPSVIRQTSTCRRDEVSSVGNGLSFTEIEEYAEKNIAKALMKHARSSQSNTTSSGQMGLPPTHPQNSPKSVPSTKKPLSPKQQYSTKDKTSPVSSSSRTNDSSAKSEALVIRVPGPKKSREEGSNSSRDSYFVRRRAREQQKNAKQNLVNGVPDEDPIYESTPQLGLVQEPSSTYDTDDNSRSVGITDDEDEDDDKSVSSDDAFESVDLDKKSKEPVITFSHIVDGMFCGACNVPPSKPDERDDRDDTSGDNHSQDSDHSDDSSRDDLEEPISPIRSPARKWLTKTTKTKTQSSSSTRSKSRKPTPRVQDPVIVLSQDETVEESLPALELEKPEKPIIKKSGNKKKAEIKKKIKDSMEKVVLRAMAASEESATISRNESIASKAEESTNGNSTYSSKKSKMSRGSRLSNWIRRKPRK